MPFARGCGILMHITSLPGPNGIGDLGESAYRFIDFLAAAGQRYWQFLPTGPVSRIFDNSPYMSLSAFAGNAFYIDPAQLVEDGFLEKSHFEARPEFSEYTVEIDKVVAYKNSFLSLAFERLQASAPPNEYVSFCKKMPWLDDYALFRSLRDEYEQLPWYEWPKPLSSYEPSAIKEAQGRLQKEIFYHKFIQYLFHRQWQRLWEYAKERDVALIGDIPIYVALDSADVWAHQKCFRLDKKTSLPTHVAGVPPDYFSETGQRWGNPLFNWHSTSKDVRNALHLWWSERFRHIFKTVDIVRIDHFRGFDSYWEIPAEEETAINGKWRKGPGYAFFTEMAKVIGDLPIIAEDLGIITEEVEDLRDKCGFPGMKVLQFAFDSDANNFYLPHNYKNTNCVVYTGTHDNDTSVGWYFSDKVEQRSKDRALRFTNSKEGHPIHWNLLKLAYGSIADVAIVPMQDVLGFGTDCRMNTPSTASGNWQWRCAERFFTDELSRRLRDEAEFYGRLAAAHGK